MGRGLSPLQSAILDTLSNGHTLTTPEIRDLLLRSRVPFHGGATGDNTFVVRRALGGLYSRGLVACHSIRDLRGNLFTGACTYVWCCNNDAGLKAMRLTF